MIGLKKNKLLSVLGFSTIIVIVVFFVFNNPRSTSTLQVYFINGYTGQVTYLHSTLNVKIEGLTPGGNTYTLNFSYSGNVVEYVNDIPVGRYRVTYTNCFGQPISRELLITASDTNDLALYFDELSSYPHNSLRNMQVGERLYVYGSHYSDPPSELERLTIERKNSGFVASLAIQDPNTIRDSIIVFHLVKQKILNESDLQFWLKFESELSLLSSHPDEEQIPNDIITLRTNNKSLNIYSYNYYWNGFSDLLHAMFNP